MKWFAVATALGKEAKSYLVKNEPAPANTSSMASNTDNLFEIDCHFTAAIRAKQLVQAYLEQGSGEVGQLLKGK